MLPKNKRGDVRLFITIVMCLIGLGIFSFQVNNAVAATRNLNFQKLYIAGDIALTLDAIHGLAGDVLFYYGENTSKYNIEISEGVVRVSNSTDSEMKDSVSREYAPLGSSAIEKKFYSEEKLSITKTGNQIDMTAGYKESGKVLCPIVDTSGDITKMDIVIDPAGEDDKIKKATAGIADKIGVRCSSCRALKQTPLKEKKEQLAKPSMVVSIDIIKADTGRTGTESTETGADKKDSGKKAAAYAAAYVNNNAKSEKIGCLIVNKLAEGGKITSAEVRRIDFGELDEDNPKTIASHETGVVVYIGTSTEEFSDAELQDFAARINEAINEYYKK